MLFELELESAKGTNQLEVELEWTAAAPTPTPLVAILTGSPSDLPVVEKVAATLHDLGVPAELRVLSAHRVPDLAIAYVRDAEARGVQVFVACAGMANHLAGLVAAHTLLPVIGVPLVSGALGGLDALLSTVQMPPGVPVATVAIDGARNAAHLAARILALRHTGLRARLEHAAAGERARYLVEPAKAPVADVVPPRADKKSRDAKPKNADKGKKDKPSSAGKKATSKARRKQ
jgi:5-(carboxyamino)imidazole ribonucleotide mutase